MRIQQRWRYSLVLALPLCMSAQSKTPQHPLDALTTEEYWTVHDVLQKSGHITDKTLTSSFAAARTGQRQGDGVEGRGCDLA